jgi:hypothetical protein
LGGDALLHDYFVREKEVYQYRVIQILVERDKGFVDGVGLSGYSLTSLYGKLLTFTGFKSDRVIQIFHPHKTREQGMISLLMTCDLEKYIDFGVGLDGVHDSALGLYLFGRIIA